MKYVVAALLFLGSCGIGVFLASHKPLWHDENVSLLYSSSWPSYATILTGNPGPHREGNICPAYYLSQKFFLDLSGYEPKSDLLELIRKANPDVVQTPHLPDWVKGYPWRYEDAETQVKARLSEIVFIGLFFVTGFLYFVSWFGWAGGALFVVQTLASFMVWAHWAESRPYGLWMLLTFLQACFLVDLARNPREWRGRSWWLACGVQTCLAMTTIQAAPQVLLFSFLFTFWKGARWKNWRAQLFLTLVPLALVAFYYSQSRRAGLTYFIATSPWDVVLANFPIDRWPWLFLGIVLVGVSLAKKSARDELTPVLLFSLALMTMAWTLVLKFWFFPGPAELPKGEFSNRYLIFLTPLGILLATYLPLAMDRRYFQKRTAVRWAFWGLVGMLVVARGYKTAKLTLAFYALQ